MNFWIVSRKDFPFEDMLYAESMLYWYSIIHIILLGYIHKYLLTGTLLDELSVYTEMIITLIYCDPPDNTCSTKDNLA